MAAHKSRATRLNEAMIPVESAISVVTDLKDELQSWLDNLPENLQNGSKADALNEAISALEDVENDLQQACDNAQGIEFPTARS